MRVRGPIKSTAGFQVGAVGTDTYVIGSDGKVSTNGVVTASITDLAVTTAKIAASAVETAKIADNNVTAGKLTATLRKGTIPLPLTVAREIVSNNITDAAGNGGILASDTTPALARINGATNKALRLTWAAGNADEIQWQVVSPDDLDDTADVTVYLTLSMGGSTDTPVVSVGFFDGIADTNCGGNTTALNTTPTDRYVTIAHGDIGAANNPWNITVTPGAHATDALRLDAAWIEYTRK